jgi:peptide/nickel transport system permease protein
MVVLNAPRLFWTLIVVAAVIAITFVVFYLLPAGDPALRFAGKNPNSTELELIRHRLGLDNAW